MEKTFDFNTDDQPGFLAGKLSSYEEPAAPGSWDDVQHRLQRRRRWPLAWVWPVVLVAGLAGGLSTDREGASPSAPMIAQGSQSARIETAVHHRRSEVRSATPARVAGSEAEGLTGLQASTLTSEEVAAHRSVSEVAQKGQLGSTSITELVQTPAAPPSGTESVAGKAPVHHGVAPAGPGSLSPAGATPTGPVSAGATPGAAAPGSVGAPTHVAGNATGPTSGLRVALKPRHQQAQSLNNAVTDGGETTPPSPVDPLFHKASYTPQEGRLMRRGLTEQTFSARVRSMAEQGRAMETGSATPEGNLTAQTGPTASAGQPTQPGTGTATGAEANTAAQAGTATTPTGLTPTTPVPPAAHAGAVEAQLTVGGFTRQVHLQTSGLGSSRPLELRPGAAATVGVRYVQPIGTSAVSVFGQAGLTAASATVVQQTANPTSPVNYTATPGSSQTTISLDPVLRPANRAETRGYWMPSLRAGVQVRLPLSLGVYAAAGVQSAYVTGGRAPVWSHPDGLTATYTTGLRLERSRYYLVGETTFSRWQYPATDAAGGYSDNWLWTVGVGYRIW